MSAVDIEARVATSKIIANMGRLTAIVEKLSVQAVVQQDEIDALRAKLDVLTGPTPWDARGA